VPRFEVQAPLDVTVLRAGVPDTVPGRSLNVCERGIGAMLAGEVSAGEVVGVEVRLPLVADPLRLRAMVRYHEKLRCGLEFLGLTTEQRGVVRDWARGAKTAPELSATPTFALDAAAPIQKNSAEQGGENPVARAKSGAKSRGAAPSEPPKQRGAGWTILLFLAAIAVAVFWWKWNRSWQELESGLKAQQQTSAEKPQAQVPAEVMEKLLVHRVEPTYPAEARTANLQGVIALDIIVGRDGSVVSMHPLNGPDVLAGAAMDALRWWKFEPYRVNGEPEVVATTVAVEFKR
jgi:outer membrane biosynthesis protein TonB